MCVHTWIIPPKPIHSYLHIVYNITSAPKLVCHIASRWRKLKRCCCCSRFRPASRASSLAAAAVLANSRRSTSATDDRGAVAPTSDAHQAVVVKNNSFMALMRCVYRIAHCIGSERERRLTFVIYNLPARSVQQVGSIILKKKKKTFRLDSKNIFSRPLVSKDPDLDGAAGEHGRGVVPRQRCCNYQREGLARLTLTVRRRP